MPAPGWSLAAPPAPSWDRGPTPARSHSRGELNHRETKGRRPGGRERTPIGGRSAHACRDEAIRSLDMKIALLPLLLLVGVQAGSLAVAADEHDRGRAEPRA